MSAKNEISDKNEISHKNERKNETITQIPCAVYEDLLPLVSDGLASEESRILVEEHGKTCPHCNKKEKREVIEMELDSETRILQKIKLQLLAWAFIPLLLGILYGMSIALSENMFQNIWIMPLLGCVSTVIYGKNSWKLLIFVAFSSFFTHSMAVFFPTEDIIEVYGSWSHYISIYVQNGFWWTSIYAGLFLFGQLLGGIIRFIKKKKAVQPESLEKPNKKRTKWLKFVCIFLGTCLTLGILLVAHAFNGNPISKFLATKSAESHLSQTYGNTDFILEEVNYNFKTGGYYARVSSPSSIDSHFTLDMSIFGALQRDYYESDVSEGWNTMMRCEDGYRDLVDSVLSDPDFPYISDTDFGSFISSDAMFEKMKASLVIDQSFDYEELGKTYGVLTFYAENEEVTLEKASEILLGLKEFFDEKQVYFHKIDFVLWNRWVDGEKNFDGPEIRINDFFYDDIYEEGMIQRVTEANKETIDYIKTEDEKMADYMSETIDTKEGSTIDST